MIWGFRIIGGLMCGAQICRAPEFGRGKGAPRQEPMMRAYRPEQPAMPQGGFAPAPQGYDHQGYDPQGYDPQGYEDPQEGGGYHDYAEAQGEVAQQHGLAERARLGEVRQCRRAALDRVEPFDIRSAAVVADATAGAFRQFPRHARQRLPRPARACR